MEPVARLEGRLLSLRSLQSAAVRLGDLLEHAGTFPDEVPSEVWERIAQAGAEIAAVAAARVMAAATALAWSAGEGRD